MIIIIIIIQKRKHHLININGLGPIKVPSENHQPFEQLPNLFLPRLRKWLYPSRASGYQGFLWQRIFQRATAHGASEYIWFPTIGVRFFFSGGAVESMLSNKKPFQIETCCVFWYIGRKGNKNIKTIWIFWMRMPEKKNLVFCFRKNSFHVGR